LIDESHGVDGAHDDLVDARYRLPLFKAESGITRKSGVARSGFDPKELASYAINPSLNCSCKCLYCSSHGVLGRLSTYRENVGNWWSCDTFVPYSNIVGAVAQDLRRLANADAEVVMSSVVDPYQPGLVRKGTPRAILEQLAPTRLRVRVLTKMAGVTSDLEYMARAFGDRATIGTSIPVLKHELSRAIEPFATPVHVRQDRILGGAKSLGMRRYVMACPIIPGSYSGFDEFAELWSRVVDLYEPEKIWFEPLNGRGENLDMVIRGLTEAGLVEIAKRVAGIRTMKAWTGYTTELLGWVQRFAAERFSAQRVRFLLYPTKLTPAGREQVVQNLDTVIWLTENAPPAPTCAGGHAVNG
jgi:DNA repair photolyase